MTTNCDTASIFFVTLILSLVCRRWLQKTAMIEDQQTFASGSLCGCFGLFPASFSQRQGAATD